MLSLLAIITYVDRVCIAVAGPRMQDELGISPEAWGWVASVFFLSYGAFEIPTGLLGDRIGPRKVLTRIVLWWSAFTSLTGVVSSYPVLLLVRFCFGMGEAGAYPNASIVIARWIPERLRARAWGVVWMTSQVGAAISPLLVVPIMMRYGWRAAFFVFGFAGVLWAAAWYWWFRDWPQEKPGVTQAELREIGSDHAERHGGMPWGRALADGTFWRIAAVGACYVYAIAFFQSWLQTYLVRGRGYTEAALVLSSLPVRRGRAGQRHRRTPERRAGSPLGSQGRPPRRRCVRSQLRRGLHGRDHRDDRQRVGTGLPVAGLRRHPAAAAESLCRVPRYRAATCRRRLRVHEHGVPGGIGRVVGCVRISGGLLGQLQPAVHPHGRDAGRGRGAVADDRSHAPAVRGAPDAPQAAPLAHGARAAS